MNRYENTKFVRRIKNNTKVICRTTIIYSSIPESDKDIWVIAQPGDRLDLLASQYYGNVSLYHYVDTDTHNDYSSVSYSLWFVPVVDASITYGMFDKDNDHVQLNVDYNINDDIILGIDITENIIDGDYSIKNAISVGMSYNF
mgnify:CR=1 FL=1